MWSEHFASSQTGGSTREGPIAGFGPVSAIGHRLQSENQDIGLSLRYATYGPRKYELKSLGIADREAIKMLFAILNAGFIYGLIWPFERKRRELLEFDFDKIAVIPPFIYLGLSLLVMVLGLGISGAF